MVDSVPDLETRAYDVKEGELGWLGSPWLAASRKAPSSLPVHSHSFFALLGIDGPAAFLKPEAPDLESKPHVLSVGSPAPEEATDGSAGGESPPVETASKPDLQEILQKHGEGDARFMAGCVPSSRRLTV